VFWLRLRASKMRDANAVAPPCFLESVSREVCAIDRRRVDRASRFILRMDEESIVDSSSERMRFIREAGKMFSICNAA
jgi:hypothetical protein